MKAVKVKTLEELVESGAVQLTRGKIISKVDMAAYPGSFPVYSSAKDNDGKFGEYGRYMFDEELITWSVDGGGKLFHRPKHKFSVTNVGGVLRIRDTSGLDYKYLYYALSLRHSEIRFDWVKKAHPSVVRKLYRDIPVPALPVQRRIVDVLDEACEAIAAAKVNAETNYHNAHALFESYLQSVFAQRGKGWVDSTLGEICTFSSGGTPSKENPTYWNGSIPWVSGRDMKKDRINDAALHISEAAVDESATHIAPIGTLLILVRGMGLANGIAVAELVSPCAFNQDIKAIHSAPQIVPRFLLFSLRCTLSRSDRILNHAAHGTLKIDMDDLRNVHVSIPSRETQNKIVSRIDALSGETQRLVSLYERKLAALEALKKSLLYVAFAGQLRSES